MAGAALAGIVLFAAANFQQVGLVHTTAANAGFITCLYVILVPIVGAAVGRATGARIWIGATLALAGLYVLSVGDGLTMARGDLLVLAGAFFWTGHILLITWLVARMEALEIALGQFVTCAVLSLVTALLSSPRPSRAWSPAAVPILYGGLLSIGVAYTLQVVAQKTAHPAHASIILLAWRRSSPASGACCSSASRSRQARPGGALMLAGMLVSQIGGRAPAVPDGPRQVFRRADWPIIRAPGSRPRRRPRSRPRLRAEGQRGKGSWAGRSTSHAGSSAAAAAGSPRSPGWWRSTR